MPVISSFYPLSSERHFRYTEFHFLRWDHHSSRGADLGFPGGAVVKNPPANAGDTGSSPGPGRSHMLRSN